MMRKITPKMEKFAMKYVECSNYRKAYEYAYSAENMSRKTVHRASIAISQHPHVVKAIAKYKAEIQKTHMISVEWVADELKKVIDKATEKDDLSNHRQAAMDMAKLYGLIIEKVENNDVTVTKDQEKIAESYAKRKADQKPVTVN